MVKSAQRPGVVATCCIFSVIFLGLFVKPSAGAENPAKYPSKPITMYIHFGPGGVTDLVGRKLADVAGKVLGQPIVVENRAGGGGITAFNAVAKAAPDGYTIGTAAGNLVMGPYLRSVPYDVKKDFTFVMQSLNNVFAFMVPSDAKWKTFKECMADARKNPDKMTVAYMGAKTLTDIFIRQLAAAEKVSMSYVPTNSGGEGESLLFGGHVNAAFSGQLVMISTGKARALGIAAEERLSTLPHVPTFAELGYKVEAPLWGGIIAPKGLNPVVLKKLGDALKKAYDDPSYKELLNTLMNEAKYRNTEAFTDMALKDYENQGPTLKRLGFEKE